MRQGAHVGILIEKGMRGVGRGQVLEALLTTTDLVQLGEVSVDLELGRRETVLVRSQLGRQLVELRDHIFVLEQLDAELFGALSLFDRLNDLQVFTNLLQGLLDHLFLDEHAAKLEVLSARKHSDLADLLFSDIRLLDVAAFLASVGIFILRQHLARSLDLEAELLSEVLIEALLDVGREAHPERLAARDQS